VYSLFIHIKPPGHGLESTTDQGLFLKFLDFKTRVIIGSNDIYLNAIPSSSVIQHSPSVSSFSTLEDSITPVTTQFQADLTHETKKLDNLLRALRTNSNTVKTKRQLKMEVPAGFCHLTSAQSDHVPKLPPCYSSISEPISPTADSSIQDVLPPYDLSDDITITISNVSDQSTSAIHSISPNPPTYY
jgi:hypothetical protein